jgi:D-amino-acid dehydrogenase
MKVSIIEREAEKGDNCSLGNAGMVVPSHFIPLAAPGMLSKGLRWMFNPQSPFYVKPRLSPALMRWGWLFYRHANSRHVEACQELLLDLNLQSRALFAEISQEGDFGLTQKGLLMLCKTQHGLDEEATVAAMAHSLGARAEVLDAAATAKMDPAITMNVAGSVWFPDDCHLNPNAFSALMRQRVIAAGGTIHYNTTLEKIEQHQGKVTAIHANGQRHEVDQLLIAGGSWSAEILRDLGMSLPLQAGKGYSLTLHNPKQLPQLCSIFCEAKVAITPMNGTLRFAGTMEVGDLSLKVNPNRPLRSAIFPRIQRARLRRGHPLGRPTSRIPRWHALHRQSTPTSKRPDRHRPRHDGPQPRPDYRKNHRRSRHRSTHRIPHGTPRCGTF